LPKPDLKTKSLDERIAYIVKHPYRIDALAILNERTASIAEIAATMGVPTNKLEHHVKDLHDVGCIEIVRSERRRGAQENYYVATLRPNISDEEWAKLSLDERHEISGLVFGAIMAEGLGALRTRTFDSRKSRHLSWRILSLDEEGWLELIREKSESLERIETIQANAYRRMVASGEKGFSAIAGAFAFERGQPRRSPDYGLTV
jgi:Helix-turn-helix domain